MLERDAGDNVKKEEKIEEDSNMIFLSSAVQLNLFLENYFNSEGVIMFEISSTTGELNVSEGAKILVIGVGGAGCNAVNTMIKSGLSGVEYIVANTDVQSLNANLAPTKIQLGLDLTKGLGAGANPEVGRTSALDD